MWICSLFSLTYGHSFAHDTYDTHLLKKLLNTDCEFYFIERNFFFINFTFFSISFYYALNILHTKSDRFLKRYKNLSSAMYAWLKSQFICQEWKLYAGVWPGISQGREGFLE